MIRGYKWRFCRWNWLLFDFRTLIRKKLTFFQGSNWLGKTNNENPFLCWRSIQVQTFPTQKIPVTNRTHLVDCSLSLGHQIFGHSHRQKLHYNHLLFKVLQKWQKTSWLNICLVIISVIRWNLKPNKSKRKAKCCFLIECRFKICYWFDPSSHSEPLS